MAEAMSGVKIVRPGVNYYFDDTTPKCPMCNRIDPRYRCRVEGTPRTAQFECTTCKCKFEKTRTVETEPEGYTVEFKTTDVGCVMSCGACGQALDMTLEAVGVAEYIACRECGAVLKSRTGQQA